MLLSPLDKLSKRSHYWTRGLPLELIRQMDCDPSSVTSSEPSGATVTPTGLPQTCPLSTAKPVMKSSYAPVARPDLSSGTRISSYPTRTDRFQEPCSAAKMSP